MKLASELQKRSTGKTLYILDEPTTGLHSDDVNRLIAVLQKIVDNGDTVLVIEHNLDVIKVADQIIDLGLEGGDNGGTWKAPLKRWQSVKRAIQDAFLRTYCKEVFYGKVRKTKRLDE